ncbi:MAG: DNA-directed RNA polymerase subunit beta' [Candidatus Colwellbacteria bacterium]|nr:DNA-directed RNA polymerase subunit beta' [Candidatus Colwellbacteria bacterium]
MDTDFKALKIRIASPEDILSWSHGEVLKPETINYRTQRPEKDGLFSERIFGPTKDWECYCGKYSKIRYKGIICDKCGVEVTRSIVRRERLGHIKLAAPVVHPWFLKTQISLILDAPPLKLEKVAYYASYIVTSVDLEKIKHAIEDVDKEYKSRNDESLKATAQETKESLKSLDVGKILDEVGYLRLAQRFGNVFTAQRGAEGIRACLKNLNLGKIAEDVEKELEKDGNKLKLKKLLRRLKLAKSMQKNKINPEWMVLAILPVLPPDLRPMVALDGGRYATSDLNDLYRRVINRNNRLKKLLELRAPDVIVVNEKRMLQEAVDALIDNPESKTATGPARRRALRSLADMLKGKQGRFRQNLLGKRVDYSGRSVIVVGPNMRLNECGIPKRMALEIFRPFVISKVIERGLAHNIRNSNRLIEEAPPEIWEILEEVIRNKVILLNRQPTLHRLSVQAFYPVLVEDLVIQIPPMVCAAFNADFDGDLMAVHLPLSEEAQSEAVTLMLSGENTLLKPASGDPIATPSQDIVLGCYYLTHVESDATGSGSVFASYDEAMLAYANHFISLNAQIKVGKLETTYGRVLFNEVLPPGMDFVNETLNKKALAKLTAKLISMYGSKKAKDVLDSIKLLGFRYATKSGLSWGMDDLTIPAERERHIAEAEKKEAQIKEEYNEGLLTNDERESRVIEIWGEAHKTIAKTIPNTLSEKSSVYMMIDSGARGSWAQPMQMMGMKGLVANPKGEIIELPIRTSLKEGHSVLEYFISTHGSRKGLVDTALKTADAGYLTRRLIDTAQDVIIREENCKTKEGIIIWRQDGLDFGHDFATRLFSRTALKDIKVSKKVVVAEGEIIGHKAAEEIQASDIASVEVRSPIKCKTLYGICAMCYGLDLGNNEPIKVGEAVGIVAAQSIGEPGTQLTLRTKHAGGAAGRDITSGLPRVEELLEVRSPKGKAIITEVDGAVAKIEDKDLLRTVYITPASSEKKAKKTKKAKEAKYIEYPVTRTNSLYVKVGDAVKEGDVLSAGSLDLRELFRLKGKEECYRYIIKEIQRVYVSEGSPVNNKHIEIVVRQMFNRVIVTLSGDSGFVVGDIVDKSRFTEVNKKVKDAHKTVAKGAEALLGLTRTALTADGFLSAASFQETSRVLIGASSEGRIDYLRGLKENVIIGRELPIGRMAKGSEGVDSSDII